MSKISQEPKIKDGTHIRSTFYIRRDVHKRAKIYGAEVGLSMSAMVSHLLDRYLKARSK